MFPAWLPGPRGFARSILAVGLVAGCAEFRPTEPSGQSIAPAKGGGRGGGGPAVNATDPTSAPQDITLDVRVFGSGFDAGSKVAMLLDGLATPGVTTNATTFVSATELVANITIASDAVPDKYDVQVTTSGGKKGIGIELFTVTGSLADFGGRPTPVAAGLYEDGLGLYDRGTFNTGPNANSNFTIHAWCEDNRAFDLVPPPTWPVDPAKVSTCRGGPAGSFVLFRVPGLAVADCADGAACPIGGPHDPALGSNFAQDVTYYVIEDTNGDGRYKFVGRNPDHAYSMVWVDGVFAVQARASNGTPCVWHLSAGTAHLWEGSSAIDTSGKPMALDVVVTRTDGVCGV